MNRTLSVRNYPRLEDNLRTVCVDDGREPHIASEVKHGTRGGLHRQPEGKVTCIVQFLLKFVALFHQDFAVPVIQRGCFLMDAQVVLWSNLM